jgi:DNA-binding transcriptional LysR family regulator
MRTDWADRAGRRLKLRDLRILKAVAERSSMAQAAQQLGISHPVISKAISELERVLGVHLFDRSSRGVEPTIYGQALLKCGTAVFDEVRQGLSHLEFLTNANMGELRIGCPEAMAAGLLPDIAERFAQQCPGARLHVAHADTASGQFDELRARNVDLLIGTMPRPFNEEDLVMETLFDERFVVVAGLPSPWVRRRDVALRDLIKESWVLAPRDSVPGPHVAAIFAENDLPVPQSGIVGLSIHLTISLVATGRFVAFLPRSIARLNAKRALLKIVPVTLPARGVAIGIAMVKNRTVSPLAERFTACAREVAKPITASNSRRR